MARSALFVQKQSGGMFAIEDMSVSTGNRWFVDSGAAGASDSVGAGRNPDVPFATWDYAIGRTTANSGDIIYLMPGHNEGLGDAQITYDVAGVRTIGIGEGSAVPRIDFDHANASIDVTADGVTIENVRLLPSVTGVLIGIDVAADDVTLRKIETLPGEDGAGVDEFAETVEINAGSARCHIEGCTFTQHASAAGVLSCVLLQGASDGVIIRDCVMWTAGAGLVAPINGDTTLSTNLLIENCILSTDAEPGIELLTGTTGVIRDVDIFADLATIDAATVADGMAHFNVRYAEVGNEAGTIVKTESVDD